MVNEHYVPRSYLRLFAPDNEGLISRYSLVEKHEGGDYRPAYDEFSIDKAASIKNFADGWLEQDEVNRLENAAKQVFEKLQDTTVIGEEGIVTISQYIAFQSGRTPSARLHYDSRQVLGDYVDNTTNLSGLTLADGWDEILIRNSTEGHEQLQHLGWLLIKNETETPFITSDEPLAQYFDQDFETVDNSVTQVEGREMYFPINQDLLLVFLDPTCFEIRGQYPDTKIDQISVNDPNAIHQVNRLQAISAFREIFGPVGYGEYLERVVDELVTEFGDEAYIRGYTGGHSRLQLAYALGPGFADTPWYRKHGRAIIRAERKKARAIWEYDHDIGFIEELRREEPLSDYWDNITVI